jgi:hypothetical protein
MVSRERRERRILLKDYNQIRKVRVETDTYAFNDPSFVVIPITCGNLCNDSEVEARPTAGACLRGREETWRPVSRLSEDWNW